MYIWTNYESSPLWWNGNVITKINLTDEYDDEIYDEIIYDADEIIFLKTCTNVFASGKT